MRKKAARMALGVIMILTGLMMWAIALHAADTYTPHYLLRKPDLDIEDMETPWGEKYKIVLDDIDTNMYAIAASTGTGGGHAMLSSSQTFTGRNTFKNLVYMDGYSLLFGVANTAGSLVNGSGGLRLSAGSNFGANLEFRDDGPILRGTSGGFMVSADRNTANPTLPFQVGASSFTVDGSGNIAAAGTASATEFYTGTFPISYTLKTTTGALTYEIARATNAEDAIIASLVDLEDRKLAHNGTNSMTGNLVLTNVGTSTGNIILNGTYPQFQQFNNQSGASNQFLGEVQFLQNSTGKHRIISYGDTHATYPKEIQLGADSTSSGANVRITGSAVMNPDLFVSSWTSVGINTNNPNASYAADVNGIINATNIYKNGIEFLGADDLGNHTATMLINAGHGISASTITATYYQINGSTILAAPGSGNIFLGHESGIHTATAGNTLIGYRTGFSNVSGIGNTYIGNDSAHYNSNGSYNTYVGKESGYTANSGSSYNTYLGYKAGYNYTGNNSILIGYNTQSPGDGTNFYLNIGNAITGDMQVGSTLTFVPAVLAPKFYGDGSSLSGVVTSTATGTYPHSITGNVPAASVSSGSFGAQVIASSIALAAMYGSPTLTGTNFTSIPNAALVTAVIPSSATGTYLLTSAKTSAGGVDFSTITAAIDLKLSSPTVAGQEGWVLTNTGGIISWQPAPSASGLTFMFVSTAHVIGNGYRQMVSAANYVPSTRSTMTATNPIVGQYISSRCTNVGYPAITSIPAGEWKTHLHLQASNANRFKVKFEGYIRNAGGTEHEFLENVEPTPYLTTSEAEYPLAAIGISTNILTTDLICYKLKVTAAEGAGTISMYADGTGDRQTNAKMEMPSVAASVANFIPYNGAVANLNMGSYDVLAGSITGKHYGDGSQLTGITAGVGAGSTTTWTGTNTFSRDLRADSGVTASSITATGAGGILSTYNGTIYSNVTASGGSGQVAGLKLQRGVWKTDSYTDYSIYSQAGALYIDNHYDNTDNNIMTLVDEGVWITPKLYTDSSINATGSVTASSVTVQGDLGIKTYTETQSSESITTANYNLEWSSATARYLVIKASTTITFSGATTGKSMSVIAEQGAISQTITWPTVKWKSGAAPVLSTTTNHMDIFKFYYTGTKYIGTYDKGYY